MVTPIYDSFIDDFFYDSDDENIEKLFLNGLKTNTPIISKNVGRIISFFINLLKPTNILDIGLGGGLSYYFIIKTINNIKEYSPYHLSIDTNKYRIDFFKDFIKANNIKYSGEIIFDDVRDYLKVTNKKFDFVFMDAGKKEYIDYIKLLEDNITQDAIIIIDNIFMGGKLIHTSKHENKKYHNIINKLKEFYNYIKDSNKYKKILINESDGLMILKRI